jgi:hypothetical protein
MEKGLQETTLTGNSGWRSAGEGSDWSLFEAGICEGICEGILKYDCRLDTKIIKKVTERELYIERVSMGANNFKVEKYNNCGN